MARLRCWAKRGAGRGRRRAQLFIGEPTAAKAQAPSPCLQSGNVPLATLRALYKRKPEAMERIEAMLPEFIGEARRGAAKWQSHWVARSKIVLERIIDTLGGPRSPRAW